MIQIFNNKESELICKTIDKNGKFYSLFKCEGYYASYLVVIDGNIENMSDFNNLFSEREGSTVFFIDMKKYLEESESEIKVVDGKEYVLAVIDDQCKFHDDYDKMEAYLEGSWEVKRGYFNYFYPSEYRQIGDEISEVELYLDKYLELRFRSKTGNSPLTNDQIFATPFAHKIIKEKGPIEVDLDFLNDI